jgi:acyl phosphate:glycerol-3-phosphate acyltransferase
MSALVVVGVLILSYLIGSVPFGLMVVYFISGKDIRNVESGRTGGTNAMRAAGLLAGAFTAILDFLKGACTVWIAQALMPETPWLYALAPFMAVVGHNYSIFLLEKKEASIRLRGGAGGATCVGGSFGLWPFSLLFILPLAAAIWYGIGFASITTISIGLISIIIFAIRAASGLSPWIYVLYGVLAELMMLWALRPNLIRLKNGTERLHGWRAKRQKPPIDQGSSKPISRSKPA